ncbi:MAG: hypothetical protein PHW83_13765 [Bacteroidales bacterium]|nr:hypothetical protein [Bacteroidales bacterium]
MKKLFFIFFISFLVVFSSNAQKVLSKTETSYVNEAKSELLVALSEPDMLDVQRIKTIRRSAVTLKEYGQSPVWPDGDIPLQVFMDQQFEQCKDEIAAMSDWVLKLENQTLDQKMKIINTMQIEVIENQVQMLIPGSTPVQLSADAISTVFGINIVEGVNGGKRQDAKDLADKFKQLAQSKELVKSINVLIENHRESLRLIDEDRDLLRQKVILWKRVFIDAYNGAFTFKGYEGAVLATEDKPVVRTNSIEGTWKFGYEQTGYFYWTFKSNGEFVFEDKMNDGDTETGTYSVSGNTLRLVGPVGQCEKLEGIYNFVIYDNDLEFKNIEDPCMSRQMTLNHIWTRR